MDIKRAFILVLLLLSIPCMVSAGQEDSVKARIDRASSDVEDFFGTVSRQDVVIVTGSRIGIEDRIVFNMIKSQVELEGIEITTDRHPPDDDISPLVLIGSEKTNDFTGIIMDEGSLDVVDIKVYAPIVLGTAITDSGRKVLMLYSLREDNNNKYSGDDKSILSALGLNKRAVPAIATITSMLFLYIWSVVGRTLIDLFNDLLSSKVMDRFTRKDLSERKKLKADEFVNTGEVIAFIISTLIFSAVMAWSWSDEVSGFMKMFLLNLMIVGVISLIREVARLIFSYRQRVASEYVFWPFGAVLTVVSTLFGNTFSMVSYTLLDENADDEKKFGKSSFIISLFTFILALVAYLLNLMNPSIILQMTFVYSIMMVFIELFPLQPMPGDDIKKWSAPVWAVSYIVVFITYIYMNFTAYA